MKPIEKNAGYEIVKYETYKRFGCNEYHIVLGHNPNTDMWVTWEVTNSDDFYWGHYSDYREQALADYHERLSSKYRFM